MSKKMLAATTATAFLLAGCSTVIDGFGSAKSTPAEVSAITPAPTGSVESSAVAAPMAAPVYGAGASTAAAAVTPRSTAAAVVPISAPPSATAPGGVAYAEPGSQRAQLAGTWTFSWDGGSKSCPVTLTTERGMTDFAAQGDVSCPKDIFMTKSWDIWSNDIVLQNHVGKVTARLKPAGPQRFEGTSASLDETVTLTR
ncbi:protease inhibitor Inh/omp19 family protein [Ancylobacter terrae]|uniref:protease inhibitor Inh/omp19 family protein n=1 Tax=Ancylobacter sp. sgz301288 TaxID=3342077 RepID=UPI0038598F94